VLYNSIKLIDQAAVDYLELLARRTQLFNLKNHIGDQSNPIIQSTEFPALTWVVKDFIQDLDGATPSQWLEAFLSGHRDQKMNELENGISEVFKSISCHTLFIPALKLEHLQDLSVLTNPNELTQEFRSELDTLKRNVLKDMIAKNTITGKMTGQSLEVLLRFLVTAANDNRAWPHLPSLWVSWLTNLIESAQSDVLLAYRKEMESTRGELPPSEEEYDQMHHKASQASLDLYKRLLFGFERFYQTGVTKVVKLIEERYEILAQNNRNRIREKIIAFNRESVTFAGQEFDAIILPCPQNDIVIKFNSITQETQNSYDQKWKKYSKSSFYTELRQELLAGISAKRDATDLKNKNLIAHILQSGVEQFRNTYRSTFNSEFLEPLSSQKLDQLHKKSMSSATLSLNSMLKDRNAVWLEKETEYKAHLALATQNAHNDFSEYQSKNENMVKQKCERFVKQLDAEFETQQREFRPFPDEEEVLAKKASDYQAKLFDRYDTELAGFSTTNAYLIVRASLKKRFDDITNELLERNINAIKATQFSVLKCLKRRLDVDACTFCLSNFVTWSYHRTVSNEAFSCFASDSGHTKLSENLKQKVINNWYDVDLAEKRLRVSFNFKLLCIVVIAIGVLVMYNKLQSRPVPPPTTTTTRPTSSGQSGKSKSQ